jgi:glutamyl/glutaminyl-tRNA synthetase
LLQVLLGLPEPIYLHHPLMRDEAGKRLAKRDESRSIAALREKGMSAAEVLALTDEALRTVFTNQREKDWESRGFL